MAVELGCICDLSAAVRGRQCSTLETIAKWMPQHWTFTDTDAESRTFSDAAARWRPTTREAGPKTSNMSGQVHYYWEGVPEVAGVILHGSEKL